MKYYSTQRPIVPGSVPNKPSLIKTVSYPEKSFCEECGFFTWGYVEYSEELSEKECSDYELIPETQRTYWAVTSSFYNDGRVVAHITDKKLLSKKPENRQKHLKVKDIYIDWFESELEAQKFVEDARHC